MVIYWTYVAAASAVVVSMLLAVNAGQLHIVHHAMNFTP